MVAHWPLHDLVVRTPRLTLRPPDEAVAAQLADLAAAGIHPPEEMPFEAPWTDAPTPELQRRTMQFVWGCWARWEPGAWQLPFAVWEGDVLVGVQDVFAESFPALRTVTTGSWLGRAHQGRGIGKEMRAAVLHLAFAGLGAERAVSGAWVDNPASQVVSRALGYLDDGAAWKLRRGVPTEQLRFLLPRGVWEGRRRSDIAIDGLEAALPMFGLA